MPVRRLSVVAANMLAMVSPPLKDSKHSWSVSTFETYRPNLTTFLKDRIIRLLNADECRRILVRGPVKSGKREMVEYLAMRDSAHSPTRVHAFASAFHRKADEDQRKELRNHNMMVFSLVKKSSIDAVEEWIKTQTDAGKQVVLHIDECDFGTGDSQLLSAVYKKFRDSPHITFILYSATPQEVLFSGEVDEDEAELLDDIYHTGEKVEYTPPPSFRGPASFLDAELIHDARPFFTKCGNSYTLTDQGKEIVAIIRQAVNAGTKRNIGVLRLSYSDLGSSRAQRIEAKAIYQFLQNWKNIPELSGFIVLVDKAEENLPDSVESQKINWSSRTFWNLLTDSRPILVVVDQTSSRSTEWKCHDRISVYHDYRNTIIFNTISQAQERVNHYTDSYGSFQQVRVYGHKKSFLLSAGRISHSEYVRMEWEARKVNRRVSADPIYQIRDTLTHELHPSYPNPISKAEADIALQELGCFGSIRLSVRVSGGVKHTHVYAARFYPCTKETFPAMIPQLQEQSRVQRNFQNPFEESESHGLEEGRYKGYLRDWRVFDFERDIVTQPGWGVGPAEPRITICYKDQQVGVALRYDTGEVREVNSIETRRSMYNA